MEIEATAAILAIAKVENLSDLFAAERGIISEADVRRVVVDDAWVDTRGTGFAMPRRLIHRLGLEPQRTRQVLTGAGIVTVQIYGPARLTIQGRSCPTDVIELPGDEPVRIDRISLLALDLVVDPIEHQLKDDPDLFLRPFFELD